MSVAVAESCFLSALQPNTSCTAYMVPSDGPCPNPGAKARRVREQVQMRMAEKKSSSLPRLTDTLLETTDYCYPTVKLSHTYGVGSRSMVQTPSFKLAQTPAALHSARFSSRSAVETGSGARQSKSSIVQNSHQTFHTHNQAQRSKSFNQCQQEGLPQKLQFPNETIGPCLTLPPPGTLRRSLSGTLVHGQAHWQEEVPHQYTYKGPSHRTISRITNRHQHTQNQNTSQEFWGGSGRGVSDSYRTQCLQDVNTLQRVPSLCSVRSVGKGMDVLDGVWIHGNNQHVGMQCLDIPTAIRYLSEQDTAFQILGATYIQHQCYHSNDAKHQVRVLHGIPALVQLFSSDNIEVQRFSTGATRNLIYENADNKAALIAAGGVTRLVSILGEPDDELRKNITGVLWNLSSKDNLKEKLSREALSELTENVLIPLCNSSVLSLAERDIFYNTTGCLRNLSSVNQRTREKMREMPGLVDSLVSYIKEVDRADDKGLENSLCILRNLSYQLYSELHPSIRQRLEGPNRASAHRDRNALSCFTVYNKKNSEQWNQNVSILSELSREPKGAEWLWHPNMVGLYKLILQNSSSSSTSQEATIGALQNITAGDGKWASVLSVVVLEQERMLPILLELLDTTNNTSLRPLTGLLRNLARHASNKDHIAKNMVNVLVMKLPSDGFQKTPSSDVVVNICGALNHLVTCSSLAARDIAYFNGLPKLVGIKTSHDNSSGSLNAARAASTVLCNMFQYTKLHKEYKLKGFARRDFADASI